MAELTFYARGDSSSANNAEINAQGTNSTATTELVFSDQAGGDLELVNGLSGLDENTTLYVDGVEMEFSLEFYGLLPQHNRLKNVNGEDLRGETIATISTEDGQRYFFLLSGASKETMDAFPNGAHAVTEVINGGLLPLCFARGTLIRTPTGDVPVEALRPGQMVLNAEGKRIRLRWMSHRGLSAAELMLEPGHRPVCIPEDYFGPGQPYRDLWLSPQHKVVVGGWQTELLFLQSEVFVAAKHIAAATEQAHGAQNGVEYFHLLFDRHEVVIANGLPSESLFPGDVAIASLTCEAREDLDRLLIQQGRAGHGYGPTARMALTAREARTLMWYVGLNEFGSGWSGEIGGLPSGYPPQPQQMLAKSA